MRTYFRPRFPCTFLQSIQILPLPLQCCKAAQVPLSSHQHRCKCFRQNSQGAVGSFACGCLSVEGFKIDYKSTNRTHHVSPLGQLGEDPSLQHCARAPRMIIKVHTTVRNSVNPFIASLGVWKGL